MCSNGRHSALRIVDYLTSLVCSCLISLPQRSSRRPSLRGLDNCLRFSKAAPIVRALLLLCLIGHASLVTVTHHHKWPPRTSNQTTCSVEAPPSHNSGGPVRTNGDTCCVSCCLQSTFANSVSPVAIPPDLSAEPLLREAVVLNTNANGVTLILSNRAPPLA